MSKSTSLVLLRLGLNKGWFFKVFKAKDFFGKAVNDSLFFFLYFRARFWLYRRVWFFCCNIFYMYGKCIIHIFFWRLFTWYKKSFFIFRVGWFNVRKRLKLNRYKRTSLLIKKLKPIYQLPYRALKQASATRPFIRARLRFLWRYFCFKKHWLSQRVVMEGRRASKRKRARAICLRGWRFLYAPASIFLSKLLDIVLQRRLRGPKTNIRGLKPKTVSGALNVYKSYVVINQQRRVIFNSESYLALNNSWAQLFLAIIVLRSRWRAKSWLRGAMRYITQLGIIRRRWDPLKIQITKLRKKRKASKLVKKFWRLKNFFKRKYRKFTIRRRSTNFKMVHFLAKKIGKAAGALSSGRILRYLITKKYTRFRIRKVRFKTKLMQNKKLKIHNSTRAFHQLAIQRIRNSTKFAKRGKYLLKKNKRSLTNPFRALRTSLVVAHRKSNLKYLWAKKFVIFSKLYLTPSSMWQTRKLLRIYNITCSVKKFPTPLPYKTGLLNFNLFSFFKKIKLKFFNYFFRSNLLKISLLRSYTIVYLYNIKKVVRKLFSQQTFEYRCVSHVKAFVSKKTLRILHKGTFSVRKFVQLLGWVCILAGLTRLISFYIALKIKFIRAHWVLIRTLETALAYYILRLKKSISGCRFSLDGKVNNRMRARKYSYFLGTIKQNTFASSIDYAQSESFSLAGILTVRFWLQFR